MSSLKMLWDKRNKTLQDILLLVNNELYGSTLCTQCSFIWFWAWHFYLNFIKDQKQVELAVVTSCYRESHFSWNVILPLNSIWRNNSLLKLLTWEALGEKMVTKVTDKLFDQGCSNQHCAKRKIINNLH